MVFSGTWIRESCQGVLKLYQSHCYLSFSMQDCMDQNNNDFYYYLQFNFISCQHSALKFKCWDHYPVSFGNKIQTTIDGPQFELGVLDFDWKLFLTNSGNKIQKAESKSWALTLIRVFLGPSLSVFSEKKPKHRNIYKSSQCCALDFFSVKHARWWSRVLDFFSRIQG